jgi:hypothetical protein
MRPSRAEQTVNIPPHLCAGSFSEKILNRFYLKDLSGKHLCHFNLLVLDCFVLPKVPRILKVARRPNSCVK